MNLTLVFTFLFGLIFGSFLNVCIYRLPRGESIVFPPSHCTSCQNRLQPKDLIPLVSYLLLQGKCRYCGEKIHWRYPIIELINGLGWVWIISSCGINGQGVAGLFLFSLSLVITLIDFEHFLIPNSLVALLFFCGLLYHPIWGELSLTKQLLGMVVGFGLPFFLALISRGGMGGGDIKLCAAMGIWLGYPAIVQAMFIGALLASVTGIALIITKIKKRKDPIPFGPFLMLGFLAIFFFQEPILFWYLSLF